MRYNIILLDADGTLLDFARSEYEAFSDTLAHFGLPDTQEIHAAYSKANDDQWKLLEKGLTTKSRLRVDRFENFCRMFGFVVDSTEMADVYMHHLATKINLIDGAVDVCRTLSEHCRLYIITNGFKYVQQGRLFKSPLIEFMSGVFISEEIGAEKPSCEYFDKVKSLIEDFDPEKALVVGDSLSSDILGGINAGLDTCWYNPQNKKNQNGLSITYTISDLFELEDIILRGE